MSPSRPRLRWQVAAFVVVRLISATSNRMVYPFLPELARGLGVSLESVALVISIRSGLGVLGPLLGSIADTRGRRFAMLLGLGLVAAGMAAVAGWPVYAMLFAGLLVSGVGQMLIDPAIYAYLGDRVAYRQRATAVSITELGWSGAFLVGIPLAGWLMGRGGWNSPFGWLALAAGLGALLLWRLVPADATGAGERPALGAGLRQIVADRAALAAVGVCVLMTAANQTLTIVYGVWLEDAFGLAVTELGAASSVIGVAGIAGVALVALLADRLGKRRAIGIGMALNTLACLALLSTEGYLPVALVCLLLFYLSFEFSLVTMISLMTELVPGARATLLAANVAAFSLGDTLGALAGPALYRWGLAGNLVALVILNLMVLAVMRLFVRVEG